MAVIFHPEALISTYDAMIQIIQACLITSKFAESLELRSKWDGIYSVTAFYVGLSDDLGPYEYMEAMDAVFGGKFDLNDLTEEKILLCKTKLYTIIWWIFLSASSRKTRCRLY